MALNIGDRIGHYEVSALIGEGGMGQVYRATNTQLNRDVALKILPEAFAADPDRVARFQREAQVLASLNHPNIAAIYGIEENGVEGSLALVLELVEGPTLAERIKEGPIPIDDALPIAKQIADALEAAHEQGIIHRDLKPANVKVKADGTVKVLDFGLAKAFAGDAPNADLSQSPTMTATVGGTRQGVILGTAAYLSPEQARGRPLDRRTDVWSFACVVYEMLTGHRAFDGADVMEVATKVIGQDPDVTVIPADVPSGLKVGLLRCLEKDPKARIRDVGDALLALEGSFTPAPTHGPDTRPVSWLAIGATAIAALVMGVAVGTYLRGDDSGVSPAAVTRFALIASPPPSLPSDPAPAITPDGTSLVYPAGGTLHVRSVGAFQSVPLQLPGNSSRGVFLSPDGRWVGYFQGTSALARVPIEGGPSQQVCLTGGASWGPDGTIVFATGDPTTGVWEVPAEGGEPVEITTLGDDGRDHVLPVYLPDGRAVLLTILGDSLANAQVAVWSRETGDLHVLTRGHFARYSPTGHLVFGRDGGLSAVRFDRETLTTVGEPVQIVPRVAAANSGAVHFDFSLNGSLTYLTEGTLPLTTLGWVGRDGEMAEVVMETSGFMKAPRLSPDGTRVALEGSGFPVYLLPDGPEILLSPSPEVVRISPARTPGGSSVAHSALVSDSWRLESIRIDDGVPHVFLASEFRESSPTAVAERSLGGVCLGSAGRVSCVRPDVSRSYGNLVGVAGIWD